MSLVKTKKHQTAAEIIDSNIRWMEEHGPYWPTDWPKPAEKETDEKEEEKSSSV